MSAQDVSESEALASLAAITTKLIDVESLFTKLLEEHGASEEILQPAIANWTAALLAMERKDAKTADLNLGAAKQLLSELMTRMPIQI